MCGLVGFITAEKFPATSGHIRTKYMHQALLADTLRGYDSTGVFFAGTDNEPGYESGYLKCAIAGGDFVDHSDFRKLATNIKDMRFVIGHNRWATVGGVTTDTAHPFQVGPITMVHNGTLRGQGNLKLTQNALKVEVDSEAVAHNLAEFEAGDVIERINGAFALIWHDARDDSLNIVRNGERELAFLKPRYQETLYLASEGKMGDWILDRNKVRDVTVTEVPTGKLHKFIGNTIEPVITDVPLRGQGQASYYTGAVGWKERNGGKQMTKKERRAARAAARVTAPKNSSGSGSPGNIKGGTYKKDPKTGAYVLTPKGGPSKKLEGVPEVGPVVKKPLVRAATELPQMLADRLMRLGYHPDDRFGMMPLQVRENFSLGILEGIVDQPCAVLGMSKALADDNFNHRWTVKPLGMKITADDKSILICQLVDFNYTEDKFRRGYMPDPLPTKRDGAESIVQQMIDKMVEQDDDVHAKYPGPNGDVLTAAEWYAVTFGGCHSCELQVGLVDAFDIRFVDSNGAWVCPKCTSLLKLT